MQSEYLRRLVEERQNIWSHMRETLDQAAIEKRDLSGEEEAKFQAANADLDRLDQRIKEITDAEQRQAEFEARMESVLGRPAERREEPKKGSDLEARIGAFLRGEVRQIEIEAEKRTIAPLNTLGTTDGGDLVPTSFWGTLQDYMRIHSGVLRANPTMISSSTGGNTLEIPIVTSVSSATITPEGEAITESEPAFTKYTMGAWKYGVLLYLTREMIEDTGVDLLGFLARQAGEALGDAFGQDLVTGAGTTEPYGVVTQSTAGATGANSVAGVFTADLLIDLYYSVAEPYRNSSSCHWMMRDATIGAIRKLKNAVDGTYLFQPSLVAGTPDTLLGKPIVTDPNVAAVAASAKSVLFGDFSRYWVRNVGGVRFERDDSVGFINDIITYRAIMRGDGVLVDRTGAIKHFVGGTA